jgi:AraC-like DNA-binding protein
VSRSQLFRKFKTVTGKSPGDIIRSVRLKKAAEIILRGEMGVNEVAYEVGFNSPSHFISSFKKYFGKTPKEYAANKSLSI